MVKRWIIRGLFMLPMLLGVGGWGWSGWCDAVVTYSTPEWNVSCGTNSGVVFVDWVREHSPTYSVLRKSAWYRHQPQFWLQDMPKSFCGFVYHLDVRPYGAWHRFVRVPYWSLILVSSGHLFWIWRKTRASVQGRAFPVEMEQHG